jgi:MtN3 and saliva related transmembrane protein
MTLKEIIAYLFGAGLLVNAGLFIPQALKIFKTRSAKEVSLMTFAGFNILQLIGILHGYLQGDPYLMVGMIASFLACGAVTSAALIYRNK